MNLPTNKLFRYALWDAGTSVESAARAGGVSTQLVEAFRDKYGTFRSLQSLYELCLAYLDDLLANRKTRDEEVFINFTFVVPDAYHELSAFDRRRIVKCELDMYLTHAKDNEVMSVETSSTSVVTARYVTEWEVFAIKGLQIYRN